MSEPTDTEHGDDHGAHAPSHYVKIWGILVVLFIISILGPEIGNIWITVITAFGIAFVKAYLVAKHFMHLNVEKPVIHFAFIVSLGFMVVLFAGISPDVMLHEGQGWSNEAAKESVVEGKQKKKSGHGHTGSAESHDKGDQSDGH